MIKSVLVTAGPTRERIDPVRFISNYSTGTFGYAIASEARRRGYSVVLISGPVQLRGPRGVRTIRVESALEMARAVKKEFKKSDCLIMAAAVSDWRAREAGSKIKRCSANRCIELIENPDILNSAGRSKGRRIVAGFALETGDLEKNALKKLKEKRLDLVIANRLSKKKTVFGNARTDVTIFDRYGNKTVVRNMPKSGIAKIILDKVSELGI